MYYVLTCSTPFSNGMQDLYDVHATLGVQYLPKLIYDFDIEVCLCCESVKCIFL